MADPAQQSGRSSTGARAPTGSASAASALNSLGSLDAQLAALADDLIAGDIEDIEGEIADTLEGTPEARGESPESDAQVDLDASADAGVEDGAGAGDDGAEESERVEDKREASGDADAPDLAEEESAGTLDGLVAEAAPEEPGESVTPGRSAGEPDHTGPSASGGDDAGATAEPSGDPAPTASCPAPKKAPRHAVIGARVRGVLRGVRRVCVVLSKPLQAKPPIVRRAAALIALWTFLLAAYVIYSVLTRGDPTPKTTMVAPGLDHDPTPSQQPIPSKP